MGKYGYGGTDWEGVAMFVILLVVCLGIFGGLGYAIVTDTNNEQTRYAQCIDAGKEWVEGNCLSPHRSLDKD